MKVRMTASKRMRNFLASALLGVALTPTVVAGYSVSGNAIGTLQHRNYTRSTQPAAAPKSSSTPHNLNFEQYLTAIPRLASKLPQLIASLPERAGLNPRFAPHSNNARAHNLYSPAPLASRSHIKTWPSTSSRTTNGCVSLDDCLSRSSGRLANLPLYNTIDNATTAWTKTYHIPHLKKEVETLTYAVIGQESNFHQYAVGPSGEIGYMQVFYPTITKSHRQELAQLREDIAERMQIPLRPTREQRRLLERTYRSEKQQLYVGAHPDLFTPSKNINDGVRYLANCVAHAEEKLGHGLAPHAHTPAQRAQVMGRALAYYNAGQAGVDKRPSLPASTVQYIAAVNKNYGKIVNTLRQDN